MPAKIQIVAAINQQSLEYSGMGWTVWITEHNVVCTGWETAHLTALSCHFQVM